MGIERTFQNIPEGKLGDADKHSFWVSRGWTPGTFWPDLLKSKRILIISEAGAGKTYECRTQCEKLWSSGEPAFFLELASLATSDLRSMLSYEEEIRFDAWLNSQSDVATFFLDSIDELKLSRGSFEQALKRLNKGITGQLARVRVVITTRPVPFDEQLVRNFLPVPLPPKVTADGESFAQVAMGSRANKVKEDRKDVSEDWRIVALMPFSNEQIKEFALSQKVDDPHALLEDLKKRNAEQFARRPQDLIELCADWRDFKRIRLHREQVAANVHVKLSPRLDREEAADLSVDEAMIGASRLALAMMLTRRLTIRHSAESDSANENVALDPALILSDWSSNKRKALLERPLFSFASYGRVRFHHRSVAEYLAAERIKYLRTRGMTSSALRRLLFAETRGTTIVRPSKRAIAGWLAHDDEMVFQTLRDHEPAVLLVEGDPEALTSSKREQALRSYVERFGRGGWRGLDVPNVQIHRLASPNLAGEINRLWAKGIENSEVRVMILQLIDAGPIKDCADLAFEAATDVKVPRIERLVAVDALASLCDSRLSIIRSGIINGPDHWPDDLSRGVALRLFPEHLEVSDLCRILERIEDSDGFMKDWGWQLPRNIATANFDAQTLEFLRDGLFVLAAAGLRWRSKWPHIVSKRMYLRDALAATCIRGMKNGSVDDWISAIALCLRLPTEQEGEDETISGLKTLIREFSARENAQLFWAADALVQSVHPIDDSWKRFAEATIQGSVEINSERDLGWIKNVISDKSRVREDRAMLLQIALRLSPTQKEWRKHVTGLKLLVADLPELVSVINEHLKSSPRRKRMPWEINAARRQRRQEQRDAKNHASWVTFWREIMENPEKIFSAERSSNTAWNIWRVMSKAGDGSRRSGWNRRFIEEEFSTEVADRLRSTLMNLWRGDRPTLASERSEEERNTYLVRWLVGLAAIYAEAEDPTWATKLADDEAKLATRFAPLDSECLPKWLEALVLAHPNAVEAVLGGEISCDLQRGATGHWYSMLLQSVGNSSDSVITVFLPRLIAWVESDGCRIGSDDNERSASQRLGAVVRILVRHGTSEMHTKLRNLALEELRKDGSVLHARVWMHALLCLDAPAGIEALEARINSVIPAPRSEAVEWIGDVFGDRHEGVNLGRAQFTPPMLLRLLRLCYRHVRPEDDVRHKGSYSPDARDNAERVRSTVADTLLRANGEEGWAAKLEMANDPVCEYFKDRILAMAEEHWAQEVDAVALDDVQAVSMDKSGEAPPSTNESMFAVMVDRLSDLDELLLLDVSPREAWAGIAKEYVMRREIARELNNRSNGLYKVDQEAATADEKETDIRLRSTVSAHEAIIELKLANDRTAENLLDTIESQLVTKYMAAEVSRSGCLLITLAKDRTWNHPRDGSSISFSELIGLLREEADRLMKELGSSLRLHVHGLDLRPRLQTEIKAKIQPKKAGRRLK